MVAVFGRAPRVSASVTGPTVYRAQSLSTASLDIDGDSTHTSNGSAYHDHDHDHGRIELAETVAATPPTVQPSIEAGHENGDLANGMHDQEQETQDV